tara:strand:+ start:89 stop:982 length:894 start_codon:yes stop_codon:yes gene_type:complete
MRLLFLGVFDTTRQSTNTSQLECFEKIGCDVTGYNYRQKVAQLGSTRGRDQDVISLVKKERFDLVVYSKCDVVSTEVFVEHSKVSRTCLWFMDPLSSYSGEMKTKTSLVHYFCCDKKNILPQAKKINPSSYHVCEGFDESIEKPWDIEQEWDIAFIGNLYNDREESINKLRSDFSVKVIKNAYGKNHAKAVSKSRINLNFCTAQGASDRVYKIMAARGLLLSNDWEGRDKDFVDGEDMVVFESIKDLKVKIDFYLNNPEEASRIRSNGYKKVQKYNRVNWAKNIIKLYKNIDFKGLI